MKERLSGTLFQTLDFATASRWCCQQNWSMVGLVDYTCDGRRVVAGRTQFITRRSNLRLHYIDLF